MRKRSSGDDSDVVGNVTTTTLCDEPLLRLLAVGSRNKIFRIPNKTLILRIPRSCPYDSIAETMAHLDIELVKYLLSHRATIDEIVTAMTPVLNRWGFVNAFHVFAVIKSRMTVLQNRHILISYGGGSTEKRFMVSEKLRREVNANAK